MDDKYREKCVIAGSELCYRLGKDGCSHCYVKSLKKDDQKRDALERWQETLGMMPQDIDALHEADTCQFCKDEPKEATGYAFTEMAHIEPYSEKGMFFGIGKKIRTPIGSLAMLQISVCDRCRKAFRMIDVLHILILVLGIVLATLFVALFPFTEFMTDETMLTFIPIGIWAGIVVAGYFISKQAAKIWAKHAVKNTKMALEEIPQVKAMLQREWFFFQMTNEVPRVSFAKQKSYERLMMPTGEGDDDYTLDNFNI